MLTYRSRILFEWKGVINMLQKSVWESNVNLNTRSDEWLLFYCWNSLNALPWWLCLVAKWTSICFGKSFFCNETSNWEDDWKKKTEKNPLCFFPHGLIQRKDFKIHPKSKCSISTLILLYRGILTVLENVLQSGCIVPCLWLTTSTCSIVSNNCKRWFNTNEVSLKAFFHFA
jgi:hypothetical protein